MAALRANIAGAYAALGVEVDLGDVVFQSSVNLKFFVERGLAEAEVETSRA